MATLQEGAYRLLRGKVLGGPLPPGAKITEAALAKQLGMSRTPIRDAIRRLVSEGLIEQRSKAGTFIKRPTRTDLENVFEVREWLESGAARAAAHRASPEQIAQMEKAVEQSRVIADDFRRAADPVVDDAESRRRAMAETLFHMTLVRASGNSRAVKIIADNHVLSQSWGFVCEREDAEDLDIVYRYHAEILGHIRRKEPEEAARWMTDHIRLGRDWALKMYDLQQRRLDVGGVPEHTWSELLLNEVREMEEEE